MAKHTLQILRCSQFVTYSVTDSLQTLINVSKKSQKPEAVIRRFFKVGVFENLANYNRTHPVAASEKLGLNL